MIVKTVINDTLADKLLSVLKKVYCILSDLYHTVSGLRRTHTGEVMVYQVNEPGTVSDGINHRNKDGILALGDDGRHLRNIRVDSKGRLVTIIDQPVDLNLPTVSVQGTVRVKDTVTVEPVTVVNMPTEMRIQEGLHVIPVPPAVKVMPFNSSEELNVVVIPYLCRVYSLYLSMSDPGLFEVPGIVGNVTTKEFTFSVYPSFVELDRLVINRLSHHEIGGYVVYDSTGSQVLENNKEKERSVADMMKEANKEQ